MRKEGPPVAHVKDGYLRMCDYPSKRDVPISNLRRTSSTNVFCSKPYSLTNKCFKPFGGQYIVCSKIEGGTYELLTFAKSGPGTQNVNPAKVVALQQYSLLETVSLFWMGKAGTF